MSLRTVYCGELTAEHAGQAVTVCGWVTRRREHGEHLAFLDVRDRSGSVQCVVDGSVDVRSEYVVAVRGTVRRRPEGAENPALATGEVEIADCEVDILARADAPPISVTGDKQVEEATRLRYRYLDLRRERMQRNIHLRASVVGALRRAMEAQGFTDIETPLLWTPTPEGAREFVVPSRLNRGEFFALPQSPQIAKQLLMVSGFDRYYQMARCARDEDPRADRQFEFTQLDIEASFVTAGDIQEIVTQAVLEAARAALGREPDDLVRMTWREAMETYGTDKPDVRIGMPLVELTDAFAGTEFRALQAEAVKAICVPGTDDWPRSAFDKLIEDAKAAGGQGLVWIRVDPDGSTRASAKVLTEAEIDAAVKACEAPPGSAILIAADRRPVVWRVLGTLRNQLGRPEDKEGRFVFVWVVDFPLFEALDEEGHPVPAHHPFTSPHPDDVDLIESDPLAVRSLAYDLVLNDWEMGSGSVRIHRPELQDRIFRALGLARETIDSRFGFLLEAFRYGVPPHAGFALGIDRFVAELAEEQNVREVIAFPKTGQARDPLTGAPGTVAEQQLREFGLALRPGAKPG